MKILVGGGTGFIGQALCKALEERGDEVALLSRQAGPGRLTWGQLRSHGLPECDAVVNLAGANVMAKRWSESYKRELFSSRIDTAQAVASAIRQADHPPKVLINASATAYYPCDPEKRFNETGPSGDDFLSRLVQQWEKATELATCRRVVIRTGVVLGLGGGALKRMLPPFKAGLGGPVGSGKQPFCWIHIDDLVNLILFAIDCDQAEGPLNAVAPNPVTAAEFATTLGKVLKKPARLRTPGFILKLLLGERADVVLRSPWVVPKRALDLGFEYQYADLKKALEALLAH